MKECGVMVISTKNLTKKYANQNGIYEIDLQITEGSVVSIIGPNGAGKSTLLNVLAGKLNQDSGEILFNGISMNSEDRRRNFGYMPDNYSVSKHLTAIELLNIISNFKYAEDNKDYFIKEMEQCGLAQWQNTKVSELSLGNKKKLSILIAFMKLPDFIILDEPTNGIDTIGLIYLKDQIIKAQSKGCSIIISSHILDFLDVVCDQHYFIKNGEIIAATNQSSELEEKYKEYFLYRKDD